MDERDRFFELPRKVREEILESQDHPSDLARDAHECTDHEKVLYQSGGNIGFCCENCGEKIGDWISHDKVDEGDWERARDDREQLKEEYRERKRKTEARHWDRLAEMGEQRTSDPDNPPPRDANGWEWHNYMTKFKPYSDEWKEGYKAYMKSDWWASRTKRVKAEKGRECKLKYPGCTGGGSGNVEVHHKSYELIGFEPLHHLVPACPNCHNSLHGFKDKRVHAHA